MIILKTTLNKTDYEFLSNYIKMLALKRETEHDKKTSKQNQDELSFERYIIPLAERNQIEAIELYCKTLSPLSQFNSKIIGNIRRIEEKSVKEPREYMALHAYYTWYVNYYKLSAKQNFQGEIDSLEFYQKAKNYYNMAFKNLYEIGKTDLIANEKAFLLRKKNHELFTPDEYSRQMSNYRSRLYEGAYKQINPEKRLKFLLNYCENLINFASQNEYSNRQSLVEHVQSALRKQMMDADFELIIDDEDEKRRKEKKEKKEQKERGSMFFI